MLLRVNAGTLRDLFNAVGILATEPVFAFEPEGVKCRVMDPSRVAMVDLELPKTAFEEYACGESMKICFNIDDMLKLVKRARRNESIQLALEGKRLRLEAADGYMRVFTMPLLEAENDSSPLPVFQKTVRAVAPAGLLRDALEDLKIAGDYIIHVTAMEDELTLRAEGPLISAGITLQKGTNALLDISVYSPPREANYSLYYLAEILSAGANIAELITIEFDNDMPVKLSFSVQGRLDYYLAPRVG